MNGLLDTHAFLWFILNDPRLSGAARAWIVDPSHALWVSPASYWEMAIKISIGKLTIQEPLQTFLETQLAGNDFQVLPIEPRHAAALTSLPFHHRDPFDRLLIAQARVEAMPLVSDDRAFDAYGVHRIW